MKNALVVLFFTSTFFSSVALAQAKPTDAKPVNVKKPEVSKAAAPTAPPVTLNYKSGLWEMTNESSFGKTQPKQRGASLRCFTADETKMPQRLLPQQIESGMSCEVLNYKLKGNVATWRDVCKGKSGSVSGTGEMTIQEASYVGTAKLQKTVNGKASTVTQTIAGKWREPSSCK